LGREQEARAEVAEVLRMSPRFILEKMQQEHLGNWHDPAHQLFLAGLRKSGGDRVDMMAAVLRRHPNCP
jgi:hypothetical protein